jgi:hypothetical protein
VVYTAITRLSLQGCPLSEGGYMLMIVTMMLSGEIPDVKRDQQRIMDREQRQAWLSVLLVRTSSTVSC